MRAGGEHVDEWPRFPRAGICVRPMKRGRLHASRVHALVARLVRAIVVGGAVVFLLFISGGLLLGVAVVFACLFAYIGLHYFVWGWFFAPEKLRRGSWDDAG